MTENVENLILEQLRKVRSVQDEQTDMLGHLQSRLNGVETQLSRISRDNSQTYAELVEDRHRVDALVARIARIEKRLELTE